MTINRFLVIKITFILQLFFSFLAISLQSNSQECDLACQMLSFKSQQIDNDSYAGIEVPSHQLIDNGGVFYRLDETKPFTGVSVKNKDGALYKKNFIKDGLVYKSEKYNKDGFVIEVLSFEENQETIQLYDDYGSLFSDGYHQIFYDDTNAVRTQGFIVDGKPSGAWQKYNENTLFIGFDFWYEGRKLEVIPLDAIKNFYWSDGGDYFYSEGSKINLYSEGSKVEKVTLKNNNDEFSGVIYCDEGSFEDPTIYFSFCNEAMESFNVSCEYYFCDIAFIQISYGKLERVWAYSSDRYLSEIPKQYIPRAISSCNWSLNDENPIFKPCEASYSASTEVQTYKFESFRRDLFTRTFTIATLTPDLDGKEIYFTNIIETESFNEFLEWNKGTYYEDLPPTISIFTSIISEELEKETTQNSNGEFVSIYKDGFDISNGEDSGIESMFEGYYKNGLKHGLWEGEDGSYINFSEGVPDGEYKFFGLGRKLDFTPNTDLFLKRIPALLEKENVDEISDPINCLSESGIFQNGKYKERILYQCGNIQQIFEYKKDFSINLVKVYDPISNVEIAREIYCYGLPYKKLLLDSNSKIINEEIYDMRDIVREIFSNAAEDLDCMTEWISFSDEQERIKQSSYKPELLEDLYQEGEKVYDRNCAACHQTDGKGILGFFPALARSDIVMNKKEEHIAILVDGVKGSAMMSFDNVLTDRELAAVMTYTQMAWSNSIEDQSLYIYPEDIIEYKKKTR